MSPAAKIDCSGQRSQHPPLAGSSPPRASCSDRCAHGVASITTLVFNRRGALSTISALCVFLLCSVHDVSANTVGEQFRAAMKAREQWCAKTKRDPASTACDILKLRPAEPQATPEGRFAHSLKLPGRLDLPPYRRGMSSAEYFDVVCKSSAGEFVYRTIDAVDGITQLRLRDDATDYMLQHLYALEDPFGFATEGDARFSKHMLVRPSTYRYLDRVELDQSGQPMRVTRTTGVSATRNNTYEHVVETTVPTAAKYAFTWRGIDMPQLREAGIGGSELIVLDLSSGEILAVRRGFIRTGHARNVFTGIWWLGGNVCPTPAGRAEYYTYEFLPKVLKPKPTTGGVHANR
jgi:hypothetical protein